MLSCYDSKRKFCLLRIRTFFLFISVYLFFSFIPHMEIHIFIHSICHFKHCVFPDRCRIRTSAQTVKRSWRIITDPYRNGIIRCHSTEPSIFTLIRSSGLSCSCQRGGRRPLHTCRGSRFDNTFHDIDHIRRRVAAVNRNCLILLIKLIPVIIHDRCNTGRCPEFSSFTSAAYPLAICTVVTP